MKKLLIIGITVIMFFFKNQAIADYEKVFFDFKIDSIAGEKIDFQDYKNKVVLLVNTASYCGFTKQYDDLQKLWDQYKKDGLIVLGIPSNSFNQEKNKNNEVKEFCEVNFSINFPMSVITDVKGDGAHEIFKWAKKIMGNLQYQKGIFIKF